MVVFPLLTLKGLFGNANCMLTVIGCDPSPSPASTGGGMGGGKQGVVEVGGVSTASIKSGSVVSGFFQHFFF